MVYKMPRACTNGFVRRSCCKFLFFLLLQAESFYGWFSLTLIGKFPGYEAHTMSWTNIWKIHPTVNFRILEHDTDRFLENSSNFFSEFQFPGYETDFRKTHPQKFYKYLFSFCKIKVNKGEVTQVQKTFQVEIISDLCDINVVTEGGRGKRVSNEKPTKNWKLRGLKLRGLRWNQISTPHFRYENDQRNKINIFGDFENKTPTHLRAAHAISKN